MSLQLLVLCLPEERKIDEEEEDKENDECNKHLLESQWTFCWLSVRVKSSFTNNNKKANSLIWQERNISWRDVIV